MNKRSANFVNALNTSFIEYLELCSIAALAAESALFSPLKLSDAFLGHYLNHNCGVFSSMVSKMVSTKRISGWLFEDLSTKKFTFVSRYGRVEPKISWHLLAELGNLEAFRRDFSFEETEMNSFRRFTIDIEVANLSKWFEIREQK